MNSELKCMLTNFPHHITFKDRARTKSKARVSRIFSRLDYELLRLDDWTINSSARTLLKRSPDFEPIKPAVHLHTPNRLIAEFNIGAYEYALTRRVSVAIATHVKFSD